MELILSILVFLTLKRHLTGFSHLESKGDKAVFFVLNGVLGEIYINGFASGLSDTGLLYFSADTQKVWVEVRRNGQCLLSGELTLNSHRTLMTLKPRPVLSLLAK